MTVDVTGLVKGMDMSLTCSGILNAPQEYNISDTGVFANINGTLSNIGACYILNGVLSTRLARNCDKCLRRVDMSLNVEMTEKFSNTGYAPKDEDIWEFTGNLIDIAPVALSCLLLELPMKTLCSEDCKGLCCACGNDLNLGECGCDRACADPRFEGLRSLFQDKEV